MVQRVSLGTISNMIFLVNDLAQEDITDTMLYRVLFPFDYLFLAGMISLPPPSSQEWHSLRNAHNRHLSLEYWALYILCTLCTWIPVPQVNPCMVPPPHIDIVVFPLLWQNATRGPKGHLCLDHKGQEGLVGAICSKILGMYLSYPCNPACDVTPTPV